MSVENAQTNGSFAATSTMSQTLKDVMRSSPNWDQLSDSQKESLELIAQRVARVLIGDKDYREHWNDVAGYAMLGGENPKKTSMPQVTLDLTKALSGE